MGRGIFRNYYKDTWTKPRGRVEVGREVGLAGVGWRGGEKMQTTVIEQQLKKKNPAWPSLALFS